VEGVKTTIPFHRQMMYDPEFMRGAVDTKYVERTYLS
jgi:biotin carboxylase